jgi:hypothetical protein
MIDRATDLIGMKAKATDGDIGVINNLYFDDERWVIRYLICYTDEWVEKRWVLVSPLSIIRISDEESKVYVNLTQFEIAKSPDVSFKKPISRRFELKYSQHYQFPIYWMGGRLWGPTMNPVLLSKNSITPDEEKKALEENSDESHLRSVNEVIGYHVQADDGSIGHVENFLIDNESWEIKHVVVNTRNWLPGKKVKIAPNRIDVIRWSESNVFIRMTKEAIKEAPELN